MAINTTKSKSGSGSRSRRSGAAPSTRATTRKAGFNKGKSKKRRQTVNKNERRRRRAAGAANRDGKPASAREAPRSNKAARNLYELLGGRDGVLDLVGNLPNVPGNEKLVMLRDILSNDEAMALDRLGRPKTSFGMALTMAGLEEKDVYRLFLDRRRAETQVILSAAEPDVAGEVVRQARSQYVPCRECGGTKIVTFEIEGEEVEKQCNVCDDRGMVLIDGSLKHQELFFDLTKLKQVPATNITTTVQNDNRQQTVKFEVGQQGTAPSPLSMIKSLDRIKDQGPRPMLPAPSPIADVLPNKLPVAEAVVVQHEDH